MSLDASRSNAPSVPTARRHLRLTPPRLSPALVTVSDTTSTSTSTSRTPASPAHVLDNSLPPRVFVNCNAHVRSRDRCDLDAVNTVATPSAAAAVVAAFTTAAEGADVKETTPMEEKRQLGWQRGRLACSSSSVSGSSSGAAVVVTSVVPINEEVAQSGCNFDFPLDVAASPRCRLTTAPPSANTSRSTMAATTGAASEERGCRQHDQRSLILAALTLELHHHSSSSGEDDVDEKDTPARQSLSDRMQNDMSLSPRRSTGYELVEEGAVVPPHTRAATTAAASGATFNRCPPEGEQKHRQMQQQQQQSVNRAETPRAALRLVSPATSPLTVVHETDTAKLSTATTSTAAPTPTAATAARSTPTTATPSSRMQRVAPPQLFAADVGHHENLLLRDSFSPMAGASNTLAWSTPSSFHGGMRYNTGTLYLAGAAADTARSSASLTESSLSNTGSDAHFHQQRRKTQQRQQQHTRLEHGGLSDATVSPAASSPLTSLPSTPTVATSPSTPRPISNASPLMPTPTFASGRLSWLAKPRERLPGRRGAQQQQQQGRSRSCSTGSSCGSSGHAWGKRSHPSPKSTTATPQSYGLVLFQRTPSPVAAADVAPAPPTPPAAELRTSPTTAGIHRTSLEGFAAASRVAKGLRNTWRMVALRFIAAVCVPHIVMWLLVPRVLPPSATPVAESGASAQPLIHFYAVTRHHPEVGLYLLELCLVILCVLGIVQQWGKRVGIGGGGGTGRSTRHAVEHRQQQQWGEGENDDSRWIQQPLRQRRVSRDTNFLIPTTPTDTLLPLDASGAARPRQRNTYRALPSLWASPMRPVSPVVTISVSSPIGQSTPLRDFSAAFSSASEGDRNNNNSNSGCGAAVPSAAIATPLLSVCSSSVDNASPGVFLPRPVTGVRATLVSRLPAVAHLSANTALERSGSAVLDSGTVMGSDSATATPISSGGGVGGAMSSTVFRSGGRGWLPRRGSSSSFSVSGTAARANREAGSESVTSAVLQPPLTHAATASGVDGVLSAVKPSFVPMGLSLGFLICTALSAWRLSVDLYFAWFDFHFATNGTFWFWLVPSSLTAVAAFLVLLLGGHVYRLLLARQVRSLEGQDKDKEELSRASRAVLRAAAVSLQGLRWMPWCGCCVPRPGPDSALHPPSSQRQLLVHHHYHSARARATPTTVLPAPVSRVGVDAPRVRLSGGSFSRFEENGADSTPSLNLSRSEYESESVSYGAGPRKSPQYAPLPPQADAIDVTIDVHHVDERRQYSNNCIHSSYSDENSGVVGEEGGPWRTREESPAVPSSRVERQASLTGGGGGTNAEHALVARASSTALHCSPLLPPRFTRQDSSYYSSGHRSALAASASAGAVSSSGVGGASVAERAALRVTGNVRALPATVKNTLTYWRDRLHIPDFAMRLRRLVGRRCPVGLNARDASGAQRRCAAWEACSTALETLMGSSLPAAASPALSPTAYTTRLARWNRCLALSYLVLLVSFTNVLAALLYFTWQWRIIANRAAAATMFAVDTAAVTPGQPLPTRGAYTCTTSQHVVRFLVWAVPPVCMRGGSGDTAAAAAAAAAWTVPNQVALLLTMLNSRHFEVAYLYVNIALPIGFACVVYHLAQELRWYAQVWRVRGVLARVAARLEAVRTLRESMV